MDRTRHSEPDAGRLSLAYLEAVGEKHFDELPRLLDPELEFTGPAQALKGAASYVSALQRLGPVLVRNEVRKTFVDGNDICVIYDFVTNTSAGAIPTVEWLTVRDGLIQSIRLYYDRKPWAVVMEEMAARVRT
jgi:hypothetical protein